MRFLCLYLPSLPIALARRGLLEATDRPLVFVDGDGPGARVTVASPAAQSRGIRHGQLARDSRSRLPGAVFLPDNASACVDELERLAAIVRKHATVSVAVESTTQLMMESAAADERAEAEYSRRLQQLVRAWSGVPVQAGVASSRSEAIEAASRSRTRVTVMSPRLSTDAPLNPLVGQTLRVSLAPGADLAGTLHKAIRRLQLLQAATHRSCREFRLAASDGASTYRKVVRPARPLAGDELAERLRSALQDLPVPRPQRLEIELARLGPDVTSREPTVPALARAG